MTDSSDSTAVPEIHSLTERARPPAGGPGVTPIMGATAPAAPDLAALYAGFRAAAAGYEMLITAEIEAAERTVGVDPPYALLSRAGDGLAIRSLASPYRDGLPWYGFPAAIEGLQGLPLDDPWGEPLARDRVRRDEIVGAYAAWRDQKAAAAEASGERQASEAVSATVRDLDARRDAILDAPVAGFDDVVIKAAVVAWWFADDDGVSVSDEIRSYRGLVIAAGQANHNMSSLLVLAADLAALAEARGLLPVVAPTRPAQAALA